MRFGQPHRHLRSCESTNALARQLVIDGAADGTLVTADRQTAGRGRQGRNWATLPDEASLAYSTIVRENSPSPTGAAAGISPMLPLAVAVATAEAIEALAPVEAAIKWPNDIWIEGRKCAGILVEARPQDRWAVLGIGVNLAVEPADLPPEARDRATSVGYGATPAAATEALNGALSTWLERPDADVTEAFRERDALAGRRISWADGSGIAAGIDNGGNLVVRDDQGARHTLSAGEVHLSL